AAPAAVAPPAKASGLPKAVSAGYESLPAEYPSPESGNSSTSTIALAALAVLVSLGAGLATIRRRHD
ncbi:MAG: LPXTG cell wall anchor domain-containing protein, partial [Marmoricola sp.]